MKQCSKCLNFLDEEKFSKKKSSPDGLQNTCKECHAVYQAEWYEANKDRHKANTLAYKKANQPEFKAWYDSLKSGPCTDCGHTYDPVCMDWDHLPQFEKSVEVSACRYSTSKRLVLEEIAKCELVCANCHRLRTKNRLNAPLA